MSEDIEATSKAHNAFGGEPLDVHVTIGLNCVWPDEECYELFFRTQVDSEQLMAEVRNHIKKVAASGNYGDVDQAMENMQAMKNSTETFSMFNSDGWLLESVSTIEVAAEGQFNREVCTIEIKE